MPDNPETPRPPSDEIDLIEVFKKIWDGRKIIYKSVAICFAIGLVVAFGTPKEYKSEITLLVETGASGGGMSGLLQQFGGLAGINIGAGSEQEALTPELYPDVIKSTPFLLEVLDQKVTESKYDSTLTVSEYLDRHTKSSVIDFVKGYTIGLPGKIIGLFRRKPVDRQTTSNSSLQGPLKLSQKQTDLALALGGIIKTREGESKNTLIISVELQDPMVAAQLADSVMKSLTRYIIDYRTQKAKVDLRFVDQRQIEAKERFSQAQTALAVFRDQNKNVILSSAQTAEQNLQSEYNLAFNLYNALCQQLEQAKMKVQEKTPVFKVIDPAKVALQKSKPKRSLILVAMMFLGGFVAVGIILYKNIITK
jgi:uncharacterized protein involved in exopolysaccharide biosynthesis